MKERIEPLKRELYLDLARERRRLDRERREWRRKQRSIKYHLQQIFLICAGRAV